MKKRFGTKGMAALLAAAMLVTAPANVFAAPAQEPVLLGDSANSFTDMQVGENATATLQNGTLTISGTGAMSDCSYSPFDDYERML